MAGSPSVRRPGGPKSGRDWNRFASGLLLGHGNVQHACAGGGFDIVGARHARIQGVGRHGGIVHDEAAEIAGSFRQQVTACQGGNEQQSKRIPGV